MVLPATESRLSMSIPGAAIPGSHLRQEEHSVSGLQRVRRRPADKVCYQQDDEGSEFSDYRTPIDTRLLIARFGNALSLADNT